MRRYKHRDIGIRSLQKKPIAIFFTFIALFSAGHEYIDTMHMMSVGQE